MTRMLSKKQVAELLGVCVATVDNWRVRRLIPYIKLGGSIDKGGRFGRGAKVLFDADAVIAAMKKFEVRPKF